MVDNLKSAVLEHLIGSAGVQLAIPGLRASLRLYHRRLWCPERQLEGAGRAGRGLRQEEFLERARSGGFQRHESRRARWLDTTANVRLHGETHERPTERFQAEQAHLNPLPTQPYDIDSIRSVRASKQFRVPLVTPRYSVPAGTQALA